MNAATSPRLLTATETAGFLLRNPDVASRVAVTEAAMKSGLYDFNIYDVMWQLGTIVVRFPGIIEPRGIQVQDAAYGLVTIQPAPAGMFYSAYSPAMGDANKPNFDSPSGNNPLGDLAVVVIAIAVVVVIGFVLVSQA